MKKIIYSTIIGLIFLSSCSLLDKDPIGIILPGEYYKTESDLNTALNGVYATLAEPHLYGNNMLGRMALDGDEGYENYSSDEGQVGYYKVSSSDTKILNYWKTLYMGIGRANILLENVDKEEIEISARARNNIKGQALFLRAYFYFMLVNKFGDVPLILEFPKSSNAEDLQKARTPMKEVYYKIVADMEEAANLVYGAQSYTGGGRVSQSAVWGILSRVCLHMAGEPLKETARYEDAAKWAKKVIESGAHELNPSYQQVFINYSQDKYDIKESIWEVEFWGNNTTSYSNVAGMVGRNNGIKCTGNYPAVDSIGYSGGYLFATEVLYNLYGKDIPEGVSATDLRRDWAIAPFNYARDTTNNAYYERKTTNVYTSNCGKFRRIYETVTPKNRAATPINYPLLRYSDVLLMYAEAVNQKDIKDASEIADAYECVNQVRRRGFGKDIYSPSNIDISSNTVNPGDDFLLLIQNERSRELCFESLRKDDLVRWGIFYDNMKYVESIIPTSWSTTVVIRGIMANVTPRDVRWPIPAYELGVNKLLTQNPGW